ncbi:MAG: amidohydrolase [Halobacteria archaeon]|nr:amidohydrolase [Halobacteria archaeon]
MAQNEDHQREKDQRAEKEHHNKLIEIRRSLHTYPEPAWCEFYTTSRVVEEVERIGVDELYVGEEVLKTDERVSVPSDEELEEWWERARQHGAREDVLEATKGGYTGAVAVLKRGDGPVVGLRVDIDALPRQESKDESHIPAKEGFISKNEGYMHACGHDAHMAIGLGVLERVKDSDFEGTFKVLFQPGEEMIAGGKPMAKSGHLDDVDYFFAVHVGLGRPTGEVVAGIEGFLAVNQFKARFAGRSAHAGGNPNEGDNAVQAMATAVQNLYSIPRHKDGKTRVNAGKVGGGTATNIIPEDAFIEGEVRGETTELKEYMKEKTKRVLRSAAEMHGCEVEIENKGEAPSAKSDQELVDIVYSVAQETDGVETATERGELGGSEDATFLMEEVQGNGGYATYVCVGTDHPTGHHTATFDVDERTLGIGVDVLTRSVLKAAEGL